MTNILLILILLIVFPVLLFFLFFYSRQKKKIAKKIISTFHIPLLKEQEFNPDISTDDWDLHKFRLQKFKRSQYKGLTFFISSENRIYYLSEKGYKVYC